MKTGQLHPELYGRQLPLFFVRVLPLLCLPTQATTRALLEHHLRALQPSSPVAAGPTTSASAATAASASAGGAGAFKGKPAAGPAPPPKLSDAAVTIASELLRLFVVEAVGRARKEAALVDGGATAAGGGGAAGAGDDGSLPDPEGTPPLGRLLTSTDIANIVPQLLLDLS
jgi:hypothetical protein